MRLYREKAAYQVEKYSDMPITIDCFKAYDIRGQIPNQLNADVAYRIGNATVEFLHAKKIVLGPDIRLSSKELSDAGIAIDGLEASLPFELIKVHYEPDGTFPNGIPNPLLPENRAATSEAVVSHKADMGIAWDGDFDRCFLFDETGTFIDGYYIAGLLAESILKKNPGSRIVHDPRMIWNTLDIVAAAGGEAVQCKSGHSFIKAKMREVDAVYGGEMSAHHYFRDFSYADSGMIPWLLVAELLSVTGKTLSELVGGRMRTYPASGEINREVDDAAVTLQRLYDRYAAEALNVDDMDGYSFEFAAWRFNIRRSNTEPVVRLNVEARGDAAVLAEKTKEILSILESD